MVRCRRRGTDDLTSLRTTDDLTLRWERDRFFGQTYSDGDARTMFLSVEGHGGRTGEYRVTGTFEAED